MSEDALRIPSAGEAKAVAEGHLAAVLPRRWVHVQAVGVKVERLGALFFGDDARMLVAAGWLHDIGYAPSLALTGFHPLDGARWLQQSGFHPRIVTLVAHHSCAYKEAAERGMESALAGFAREESAVADALWYADMTTGPDGQNFAVADRLAEIRSRYGADHPVGRFIVRAEEEILAAGRRTEERLMAAGLWPSSEV